MARELPQSRGRPRPSIVATSTFPIHPRIFGGQLRIFNLLRELARDADVHLVSLTELGEEGRTRTLAPGLLETTVPKSPEHLAFEREASARAGAPVGDIVAIVATDRTPEYARRLAAALVGADVVVLAHPFLLPAVRALRPDLPLAYDAVNAETRHKEATLPESPARAELIELVRGVEAEACRSAGVVSTTGAPDADALTLDFGIPDGRLMIVANGVDLESSRFVTGTERRRTRQAWLDALARIRGPHALDRLAVFVGSGHQPNIEACETIAGLARRAPRVAFAILGGVSDLLAGSGLPANCLLGGWVTEFTKRPILAGADAALNPIRSGYGSNVKLPEYLAVGAPVVTTSLGARGFDVRDGTHVLIRELDHFETTLESLWDGSQQPDEMAARGRELVSTKYSWSAVAGPWRARVVGMAA